MLISLLQKQIPLIDVRAPVEFSKGALPTSTNLPILLDEERELVGKAYKKLGGQSATELGHAIVKDKIKEQRIKGWLDFIEENPSAHLYCARGGQRSEIAQSWIAERGIDIPSELKRITGLQGDAFETAMRKGEIGADKVAIA